MLASLPTASAVWSWSDQIPDLGREGLRQDAGFQQIEFASAVCPFRHVLCDSILLMSWYDPLGPEGQLVTTAPSKTNRIPSLDGLRAFSIALVLLAHLAGTRGYPQNWMTQALRYSAHFGVTIFFVISGFLITRLLLKEHEKSGQVSLLAFYRRRTFRIFPAAYFYIACITLVAAPFAHPYLLQALTYTMCYTGPARPWLLGHLWSLSVEEQFYLLWPTVFALYFGRKKYFAWAVVFLAPLFRMIAVRFGYDDIGFYFPTVADSIAAGCLLAIYYPEIQRRGAWITRPWVTIGIIAATVLVQYRIAISFRLPIYFGGVVAFMIALVIFSTVERPPAILNNGPIIFIGTLSYSLYLWQQPFLDRTSSSPLCAFPLNLFLTFVAAYASYRLVERPMLRFQKAGRREEKKADGNHNAEAATNVGK